LPDVAAEQRVLPFHDRRVLVGRTLDRQLAVRTANQPSPPAAESRRARLRELLLERRETAKGLVDRGRKISFRRLRAARRHQLPDQRVVAVAATVVPHGGPLRLGYAIEVVEQLLDRLRL